MVNKIKNPIRIGVELQKSIAGMIARLLKTQRYGEVLAFALNQSSSLCMCVGFRIRLNISEWKWMPSGCPGLLP